MLGNKFKYYKWLIPICGLLLLAAAWNDWLGAGQPDMQKWEGNKAKVAKFDFKDNKFDTASLRRELLILDIECQDIVYAQARLETGNFTSKLFLKNNNLFGFKNKKGQWMKFSDWKSCCKYYKDWQAKRYKGGDYYQFLVKIGYAEDTSYIKKVKKCLN